MIPGAVSRLELASTAQGRTRSIAARTLLGREPAREHDPAFRGPRPLQVLVVLLEPGQVEHAGDLASAAQQHAVPRAVAVLPSVELDEVGAVVGDLAHVNRDREHRLGNGQHPWRAPRRLLREHEACEVGAGFRGRRDVLLARQAADLHERPRDQLGQLRRRVARPHQRGADQHRLSARELGLGAVGSGRDAALGDDHPVVRRGLDELQLRPPVDREGIEVARVDPDRVGSELDGAPELVGVVRLHEGVEPESSAARISRLASSSSRSRRSSSTASAPASRRAARLPGLAEEALREQRQRRRLPRRPQVVDRAAEALVHENRDRGGACALERGSEGGWIGFRAGDLRPTGSAA